MRLPLSLLVVVLALSIWAQSEEDEEIIKNLDFFVHMEVLESEELVNTMENDDKLLDGSKEKSGKGP